MDHKITTQPNGLKKCSCGSRSFVNGKCGMDKSKQEHKEATILEHCLASLNAKH